MIISGKRGFIIFCFLCVSMFELKAQCNADDFMTLCIPKLSAGFNVLRTYKIDNFGGEKKIVEYSYVLTKGTEYMINMCEGGETTKHIIVDLFDRSRNKVASSKAEGLEVSSLTFPCSQTAIYYIQYTFSGGGGICAGSALGFRR